MSLAWSVVKERVYDLALVGQVQEAVSELRCQDRIWGACRFVRFREFGRVALTCSLNFPRLGIRWRR